jgi:hypothetical protein
MRPISRDLKSLLDAIDPISTTDDGWPQPGRPQAPLTRQGRTGVSLTHVATGPCQSWQPSGPLAAATEFPFGEARMGIHVNQDGARSAGRRAVIRRSSCRRPPSPVPATTVNQPYIYTSPHLR